MRLDRFTIRLPEWTEAFAAGLPDRLIDEEARMEVAITLAEENVRMETGGPFGAVVVAEDSGEVLALGVNRVEPTPCSSAHAEIVALGLAQAALGLFDLSRSPHGACQLVTSCEPCAMCLGAVPWSGVRSVLCGATKADAEAVGFDEGDRPADWESALERRGIRVATEICRPQARAVLQRYARQGGLIYQMETNPADKE